MVRTWTIEAAANQEGYFFLPDEAGVNDPDALDGIRVVELEPLQKLFARFEGGWEHVELDTDLLAEFRAAIGLKPYGWGDET